MPLAESNTFTTPSGGAALALSRIAFNDSHKATSQSYYSDAAPDSENINLQGTPSAVPDGMLFRSSLTGGLYVSDPMWNKGNPVYGGNWTRNGIGSLVVPSLASLDSDAMDIGEVVKTVGSNARVYVKSTNVGVIVDIGLPLTNSITTAFIIDSAITSSKISNGTISNIDFVAATMTNDRFFSNGLSNTNFVFDGITTDRIANSAIVSARFADSAVTTDKFIDSSVTSAKIVNSGVTTDEISNGAVTTAEFNDDAVTLAKLEESLRVEAISYHLHDVDVQGYPIDRYAPYDYAIIELTSQTLTGSGEFTLQINGSNVGNVSSVPYTTTRNTHIATSANSVSQGDNVAVIVDTASSIVDFMWTIKTVRT